VHEELQEGRQQAGINCYLHLPEITEQAILGKKFLIPPTHPRIETREWYPKFNFETATPVKSRSESLGKGENSGYLNLQQSLQDIKKHIQKEDL